MKKFLSILLVAVYALTAWAGEKTITISRNDVAWESANTVYNVTKGGVELVMSGGMNNPNFLLMKQHTTITVKSHNFNIKRIVFHCLDNYTSDNLDPFYWGPTTLHIQYSQTHAETAGTLTYNYQGSTYDALWRSTKSSNPGNYPNGLPAGYELMFENEGKPVRFASIDIVVEQEVGDIYELVTSQSEIQAGQTYILVGRQYQSSTTGRALSVYEESNDPSGHATRQSTPVELLENGYRVKATGDVQLIKLEATGNSSRPYYLKMGSNYLRRRSGDIDGTGNNKGWSLYGVSNLSNYESDLANYYRTSITINGSATYYNALIRFGHTSTETSGGKTYAIRHSNANKYFRDLDYSSNNSDAQYQRVYLYKPAQQYKVTTEVQPDAAYGSIALRDGVLVDNGTSWSQKMDTVQFLVTAADGYKIANIAIQARDANQQVVETIAPLSSTQTINGTLYTFVMPGYDAHIIATFEAVTYHDINIEVKPSVLCGNVFITEGYVVQNDQVKSYDGQTVVFNVTPNPINPADESEGYYELSYVTVTINGEETTLTPDASGNYSFTMPDEPVTITAYFYDNTKSPLWLLGTANGNDTWHTYGPRFNYDNETDEYYIDVYFKGTGNYNDQTGDNFGHFSVTWKIDMNDNWNNINGGNWRGVPGESDYYIDENTASPTSANQYLWYGSEYENYSYKIPAGIYRISVGTTASAEKGNLEQNQLRIVKYVPTLTLDPAGGATAAEAPEVGKHQVVTLAGDLYSRIKAINPNEADINFFYKTVETIDGASEAYTVNSTTTASATLDVVNEGTTVTQLDGVNYLGWIVASNTGYYKVIDTPLHWIEEYGEQGSTYTVSDRLQGIFAIDYSLWCKDLGDISIVKTEPADGQIDLLWSDNYTRRADSETWDQSNWVELDFSDYGAQGLTMASDGVNHYITAGTVTGEYIDDVNYKIKVNSGNLQLDGDATYVPNTYCTVNFLESNLTLHDGDTGPVSAANGKYYYLLNPKVQEYAVVTYAMWDTELQIFVVPAQNGLQNSHNFSGAFRIGEWDYNIRPGLPTDGDPGVLAGLDDPDNAENVYKFHMIVKRDNKNYGTPAHAAMRGGQTASPNISVWPIDLQIDPTHVITAVADVRQSAQVAGVTYVNVAGVASTRPWSGVNIVVTRYTDGTTTATKQVR